MAKNKDEASMALSRIALTIIVLPLLFAASASIALADEDIDSQIQHYTQELKARPKSVGLLIRRGDLYFKVHQFDKAVADYSAAIKLDDHADKAYFGRGLALGRNGNIPAGIKDLSVYIGRHPTDSYGHTMILVSYTGDAVITKRHSRIFWPVSPSIRPTSRAGTIWRWRITSLARTNRPWPQ
jgi:tetratricopeptide (TPR) repeat protein